MSASTTATPVSNRAEGARRILRAPSGIILPTIGVVSVLAGAEWLARSGMFNQNYLPRVTEVFGTLIAQLARVELWAAVGLTLQGWALGLLIAALIGIPVGLASGLSAVIYHSLRPVIEFLRPVPSVALVPLAVVMLGTGMDSKVLLAAFASTWPILVHSMYGIRDLDPLQLEVARSYQVGRVRTIFGVLIPGSVAHIATGLRIASSISLALVVSTEIIIGAPGLGQLLNVARASGNVREVFALILITGALGVALNAVVRIVERRALNWHVSHREVTK